MDKRKRTVLEKEKREEEEREEADAVMNCSVLS
jgi:hypothetical protein